MEVRLLHYYALETTYYLLQDSIIISQSLLASLAQ